MAMSERLTLYLEPLLQPVSLEDGRRGLIWLMPESK